MEEQITPKPRRRRKSKMQIFKEERLPYIILAAAAVMILISVIGSIAR